MEHRAWRGAIVAVILLAVSEGGSAGPDPEQNPWLRVETPNFILYGEVSEARLLAIAGRLNSFRSALERLHPGTRASPRETSVYVFRSAASGWSYTPVAESGHHRLGVVQRYDVPNYATVAAPVDDPPLGILFHSYAHQFLDDNFPRLPLTVSEGLAEFYSGFQVIRGGALIGLVNDDHVRWLRDHPAPSLSTQFAVEARAPLLAQREGGMTFVAGSWALMHYLVSGIGPLRSRLPDFLEALQQGAAPADATRSAFDLSFDDLEQRVAGYVRGDRFLPLQIRGPAAGADAVDRDPPRAHPMTRDERLVALGAILGHAGPKRAADAEALFEEALHLNPRQARAYSGLGYLRFNENRFDEAIPLFEKAIAIDPDAMTCYLLARSLLKMNSAPGTAAVPASADAGGTTVGANPPSVASTVIRTPPWLARVRALLSQAISLRPRFAAPHVALGATHLFADGDPGFGVEPLLTARDLLPARTDIAGNLVHLFLRQGDTIRARMIIDQSLVNGGDEETLAAARAAVRTFEEHVAARRSLYRARGSPGALARDMAAREERIGDLREKLNRTRDPEEREQIEATLHDVETSMSTDAHNQAIAMFNDAVDRANKRDYPGAIAVLEGLLPQVADPDLKARIVDLLERFRRDSVRLQQVVP